MTIRDVAYKIGNVQSRVDIESVTISDEAWKYLFQETSDPTWEAICQSLSDAEIKAIVQTIDDELQSNTPFGYASDSDHVTQTLTDKREFILDQLEER